MSWEMVAGLETHVELSTLTKIFCSCSTQFGGAPNTHCCPVCTGQPGSLPALNARVVEYAMMAGLALGCELNTRSVMARKHYIYPDLPKAYQISQYEAPLCTGGYLTLSSGRRIGITRIHIEEDAGKLIHEDGVVLIDYNRGGVPLIEIVTEPDFRSPDEVTEYLESLQGIFRSIGVSDCRMQEGSMRCDVNISVRRQGEAELGTRTEIKNMNSLSFITKAIKYEFERQVNLLEKGREVIQETRRYDEKSDMTEGMRGKEDADDYRYFPEPDIVTILISDDMIARLRASLPELPDAKVKRYVRAFGLPERDAQLLVKYKRIAAYFEEASYGLRQPKNAANFILGQVFQLLGTDEHKEQADIPASAADLNVLLKKVDDGKLNVNQARAIFARMLTGEKLSEIPIDGTKRISHADLAEICKAVIGENPAAAADYQSGKEKAIQTLIGGVMKRTKGNADAAEAKKVLVSLLGRP